MSGFDHLALVFLLLGVLFLFYTLNYHTLNILIEKTGVTLGFGLIHWTIPLEQIEDCRQDDTSLWRIGGAGIHFSPFNKRYRAMFNFLEYPRVLLILREKRGLVRDIAFSTRQPEEVIRLIRVLQSSEFGS